MATIVEDTNKAVVKRTPRDFLNTVVGRPVVVKLNNGVIYQSKKSQCCYLVDNCSRVSVIERYIG